MDYRHEASLLGNPPVSIIDAHTHINGTEAATLFAEVMDLYGIEKVWSMTALDEVESVREALDGRFEPIAVPDFRNPDRRKDRGVSREGGPHCQILVGTADRRLW